MRVMATCSGPRRCPRQSERPAGCARCTVPSRKESTHSRHEAAKLTVESSYAHQQPGTLTEVQPTQRPARLTTAMTREGNSMKWGAPWPLVPICMLCPPVIWVRADSSYRVWDLQRASLSVGCLWVLRVAQVTRENTVENTVGAGSLSCPYPTTAQ